MRLSLHPQATQLWAAETNLGSAIARGVRVEGIYLSPNHGTSEFRSGKLRPVMHIALSGSRRSTLRCAAQGLFDDMIPWVPAAEHLESNQYKYHMSLGGKSQAVIRSSKVPLGTRLIGGDYGQPPPVMSSRPAIVSP